MRRVAALFTRADSVYRELGADCYDAQRDARTFDLACPVVAHPPCRAWGQLAHMARPRPDERDLALWAVHVVRHCGGVLEHPYSSRLWPEIGTLSWGIRDRFGGVLVPCMQSWWGHRAPKRSAFYIVGPVLPMPDDSELAPTRTVERMCRQERERTPPRLASWLLHVARAAA